MSNENLKGKWVLIAPIYQGSPFTFRPYYVEDVIKGKLHLIGLSRRLNPETQEMAYPINGDITKEYERRVIYRKTVVHVFDDQTSCVRCSNSCERLWQNWWSSQKKQMQESCDDVVSYWKGE
ncbi:hypothetical protein NVP1121O_159 [Vibrio phage 1.121.O._10N.286.46.C4]|nr:hypothetical protein NVP1121O_159 [Vibrio phage 1.121.O._10N.286.46.C4]